MSLFCVSSSSRTDISPTVGEGSEDEDEEERLSCFKGVREDDEEAEDEVLRIPVSNEMWFLTIDSFVGIPVFIAKLSERQYCWRVFEDFHY